MNTADDIYAQRKAERAAELDRRREMENRLHDEYLKGTPRARRAGYFAKQVLSIVDKFVPEACRDAAHEEIMLNEFCSTLRLRRFLPIATPRMLRPCSGR